MEQKWELKETEFQQMFLGKTEVIDCNDKVKSKRTWLLTDTGSPSDSITQSF